MRHHQVDQYSHYSGHRRRRGRDKGAESLFKEIMAKNFLNLGKETDIQIQEAQRVQNKKNPKRSTLRHIRIKMSKVKQKERILKAAREK